MTANRMQSEAWNGAESAHYIDQADRYDRQLAPFTDVLLERARPTPQDTVLDVGCGCGATTLALADVARSVLGVDISAPLLEVASTRARSASIGNAEFLVADAQTHAFEDRFDLVVSQFGLMFFDDPLAAFHNLSGLLRPGGRTAFVSWQGLEANQWLMVLGRALARRDALPALGGLSGGPGMFALENADEIAALLDASGFTHVEVEPITPPILVGGGGTLEESMDFLLGTGIVRGLLDQVEQRVRSDVISDVRDALVAHDEPGIGVEMGSAGWLVSADVLPD